jgi:hypothetical protein
MWTPNRIDLTCPHERYRGITQLRDAQVARKIIRLDAVKNLSLELTIKLLAALVEGIVGELVSTVRHVQSSSEFIGGRYSCASGESEGGVSEIESEIQLTANQGPVEARREWTRRRRFLW